MSEIERANGLLPCPFCGAKATLIDAPEAANEGAVVVECNGCRAGGPVVFGVKDDPKPHAIETWNRRIHPPDSEEAQRVARLLAENEEWARLFKLRQEREFALDSERDALRQRVDALKNVLANLVEVAKGHKPQKLRERIEDAIAAICDEATPDPAPQREEVKEG